ncbi:hypothetical protein AQ750_04640 [Burkholderia pseudomallei]|nr:hypothetical protein AQ736_03360 [Burkholderia pseudomallei]OMS96427.1 hypothetical protein AQ750_04640 [Burkholderia pseudomallei]OMV27165.1 hypothetical protein AQ787_14175 [Burkholderia pseudomallei]
MDAKIPKSSDCKVTFTLETTLDLANQALAFYGSTSTGGGTGATTFTGKVLPATMQVGFDYMFGPAGATITSLVDSSTTPVTVAATDYTVNRDGTLTINNLATYKLPLIASGNLVAYNEVNILDQPTQDIALIFNGLNTMTGKAVVVKFPRIRLNPAKSVSFIGNDWVKYELEGQALADPQAIADAAIADDALLGYGSVQFVE